jgi:hypothetical protein
MRAWRPHDEQAPDGTRCQRRADGERQSGVGPPVPNGAAERHRVLPDDQRREPKDADRENGLQRPEQQKGRRPAPTDEQRGQHSDTPGQVCGDEGHGVAVEVTDRIDEGAEDAWRRRDP